VTPAAVGFVHLPVRVACAGGLQLESDAVAEEVPVALQYNGAPHAVMMATPAELEDFALGFSITESIIQTPDELSDVEVRRIQGGSGLEAFEIAMTIPPLRGAALGERRRSLQGRTGCGLCGAETLDAVLQPVRRVPAGNAVDPAALHRALTRLRRRQPINAATGATHAAAWARSDGEILAVREDVGRHNALDKLIGHLLGSGKNPLEGWLLLTSRASYEMVLKASVVGIPVVAAISAPTAYAVRIAEEAGITLIAFAREDRFVVYACPGRLLGNALEPQGAMPGPG
jgi:FdhD protein